MGFKTFHVTRAARCTGHATVTWSRSGRDGVRTSRERIVRRLAPHVRARDIVLLHDGEVAPISRNIDATIAALPDLLASWRAGGLEIVRLDDLLGVNAYQ
jgi:peptidoglycan-N-acetylglucosamine deacetylase